MQIHVVYTIQACEIGLSKVYQLISLQYMYQYAEDAEESIDWIICTVLGCPDHPAAKSRRPAVNVNKLRNKPKGLKASEPKKLKTVKQQATQSSPALTECVKMVGTPVATAENGPSTTQMEELAQQEAELAKEEIHIPETETLRGIHRTVHIPAVLNEPGWLVM